MKTYTTSRRIFKLMMVMLAVLMTGFASVAYAAKSSSADAPFDHSKTGFVLKDVHATLKCEQCHVEGIFKNTPKECAGCHTTGTRVAATPKPINHVPTTSGCDTCHVSTANFLVKSYAHVGITGGCATCHNGQSLGVVSKPVNHFPTSLPCESCHTNTSTFLSTRMDHTGVTTGCAQCHGGQFAGVVSLPPVPTGHIPLQPGQDCNACHSGFTTFLGAVYNHSGVVAGTCATCHSGQMPGVVSVPPISKHIPIPSGQDCSNCHNSTSTFLGAMYSHIPTPVSGSCDTCHTGAYPGVMTKPANHIPTQGAKCDTCHTGVNTVGYTTFLGAVYHATATPAAGSCAGCHNGAYTTWSAQGVDAGHIPISGSPCDLCHTASNTGLFTSFTGAAYHANVNAVAGTCSNAGCHDGISTTSGALGKNAALTLSGVPHVTTTSSCDTCHTQATTANYSTFLGALFNHAVVTPAVAGRCSACHGNITPAIAKEKSASHLPTTAECDTCHTQSNTANYTTFLGAGYHASTAVTSGSCGNAGCHDGSGTAGAVGKPATHLTTSSVCDLCHTSSTTSNFTTWLNATYHSHVTVTAGTCGNAGCHDGSANGLAMGATGKPASHVTTTSPCDTCHTSTANYTTWLGATYTHTAAANGICNTCHDGVQASGQLTPHIPASGTCDGAGCHTTAVSNVAAGYPSGWAGATYAPHPGSAAGTCSTCHSGTYPGVSTKTFNPGPGGLTSIPGGHQITSAQCDTCHTAAVSGYLTASPTWAGAGYDHTTPGTSGNCGTSSCHGPGGNGKGVSANHYPVGNLTCDSGNCHKVFGGTVNSFAGGVWNHSVAPMSAVRCDSCHNGAYTTFGTYGAVAKVSNHIPTTITGALDCSTCHRGTPPTTAATMGAGAWATGTTVGEVMNHNGAQGGAPNYCVTCHLTGTTYLVPSGFQRMSHNGASTSKDCSRSSCHRPLGNIGSAYSSWN